MDVFFYWVGIISLLLHTGLHYSFMMKLALPSRSRSNFSIYPFSLYIFTTVFHPAIFVKNERKTSAKIFEFLLHQLRLK